MMVLMLPHSGSIDRFIDKQSHDSCQPKLSFYPQSIVHTVLNKHMHMLSSSNACIGYGTPRELCAAIQGRHVHFEDPFPRDDGTTKCGVRGYRRVCV